MYHKGELYVQERLNVRSSAKAVGDIIKNKIKVAKKGEFIRDNMEDTLVVELQINYMIDIMDIKVIRMVVVNSFS